MHNVKIEAPCLRPHRFARRHKDQNLEEPRGAHRRYGAPGGVWRTIRHYSGRNPSEGGKRKLRKNAAAEAGNARSAPIQDAQKPKMKRKPRALPASVSVRAAATAAKASRGTEAASAKPPAAEAAHAEARPCGKISNRHRRARKKSSRPASKTASRHMLQKAQPRLRITRRAPKTMRLHHRPSARPEHLSPRAMPMVKRHFMQPLILAPIIAAFWWPRPHAPASFVSWMPFRASYGLAKA